uniref:Uncharacterized protein n=1 Tax=Aegilops tauschii subsp. strangulata TaxID=200361 RepID=A0A453G531_AEGTS
PTYPALVLPNPSTPAGSATAAPSDGARAGSGGNKSSKSSKLVPAILLPLLTVAVLGLSIAFFFKRRRTNAGRGVGGGCVGGGESKFLHPERASLFARDEFGGSGRGAPATTAASTAPSAEFLYVGTLAGREDGKSSDTTSSGDEVSRSSGGSPELRPLPPLVGRQCGPAGSRSPGIGGSSPSSGDEEFYSPRGSSKASGSQRTLAAAVQAAVAARDRSRTPSPGSAVSTPSYPSSRPGRRCPLHLPPRLSCPAPASRAAAPPRQDPRARATSLA